MDMISETRSLAHLECVYSEIWVGVHMSLWGKSEIQDGSKYGG